MTSNIAGQEIQDLSAEDGADWEIEAHVKDALKQYFHPEFLNRIDEVIVFHMLSKEHLRCIVDLQLQRLADRLKDRHIGLEYAEAARDQIMDEGYDPVFGARPLKRAIQQRLENPLAARLLAGTFGEGDTVRVDAANYRVYFDKAPTS
jgi:ATP-dependent Clp protease ATP-binding subunit ClpB